MTMTTGAADDTTVTAMVTTIVTTIVMTSGVTAGAIGTAETLDRPAFAPRAALILVGAARFFVRTTFPFDTLPACFLHRPVLM